MSQTYFAMDGSYGDADEILIVDTSDWTEGDWEDIHEASDNERSDIAQALVEKYR